VNRRYPLLKAADATMWARSESALHALSEAMSAAAILPNDPMAGGGEAANTSPASGSGSAAKVSTASPMDRENVDHGLRRKKDRVHH
jgi:hypothetical protein